MDNYFLCELFETTRKDINPYLGIDSYLALLEALEKGYGLVGKEELYFVCESLWIQNRKEQATFRQVFERYSNAILKEVQEKRQIEERLAKLSKDISVENKDTPIKESDRKIDNSDSKDIIESDKIIKSVNEKDNNNKQENEKLSTSATIRWENTLPISATNMDEPLSSVRIDWQGKFKMRDDAYQPIPTWQLQRGLHNLKVKSISQRTDNMDIPRTVRHFAKQGVLKDIFYYKSAEERLPNILQLVLLVDFKGSMIAFRSLADRLTESVGKGIKHSKVVFFRNAPSDTFYAQPNWTNAIPTKELLSQLSPRETNVLIFSDAGAARGNFNPDRLQNTWQFLDELKPNAKNIIWLNPMPKDRWEGSTAAYIARLTTMLEADRLGVEQALMILKGLIVIKSPLV